MSKIVWDNTGERLYETGVDHGVLYLLDKESNQYKNGVGWNGLTAVTENPTGAESNPQYADNIKYLDLYSAEEFGATIEAFTYPKEFEQCDGTAEIATGITIGQQARKTFGMCYRTKIGNDVDDENHGYKLHFLYGAKASPSEKAYNTINDSPEPITFSWEVTTVPVQVPGYKATASLVINSTLVDATKLKALEDILYGKDAAGETTGTDPRLPLPSEIIEMFKDAAG